jgi:hypothetical protein
MGEEHPLPDPKPVYVITIFENFSRMVLSSAISATQNHWDYLAVLTDAIRSFGAPEAIVTDGGGQFYTPTVSVKTGDTAPPRCCVGCWGRTIPEEVLSRALYATQFTRQIDKHGYIRFKHWRFFGENGLAGEEVSVWVYEDTLKVEHQATTLSLHSVRLSPDQRQITEVKDARRLETHFRSPQLDLWQLSDTEWLLALRRPEPVARKKPGNIVLLARQLPLLGFGATG